MPKMRIPQYIEKNTHFLNVQQILAYAKKEDTSVYRDKSTFCKSTTNTSLGQKCGYLSIYRRIHIL